ncbi:MAG: bifunctional adenosylcobinamide kinase/adenosylcobinamide-phosphate guanylyltransferase [Acidaminococcaceae bacterium]|nr:bifunctional adenosylcobinamide kinase/adenosylcobinamide-phosphate guanylyltransferase [Acidaminococcaceae bacterium]
MNDSRIVLVTGGARSGKSEFAERYVLHYAEKCSYLATSEIFDEEMEERVKIHRARRDNGRWLNYEAPYEAEKIFAKLPEESGAVLFDCLTIYMANLLYGKEPLQGNVLEKCDVLYRRIDSLIAAARNSGKIVVFVTNEVGSSIVPENAMAREYRDLAGWVNQRVAEAADEVYLCVAGQAVDVKKNAFKFT